MRARAAAIWLVLCVFLSSAVGCAGVGTIDAKISRIQQRHGVTVRADNPLSRCYLFGNLPGLLDRIDRDLERSPQFFKDHIGPVVIEESFLDNPPAYPLPGFVRGYVTPGEADAGFPLHIKNRSLLEKVLLFSARDGELFLHEASHSFEFNLYTREPKRWQAFLEDFEGAGGWPHASESVGSLAVCMALSIIPPLGYVRVPTMPSLYGWVDHFEDFAETHCYMARHGGDVEFLRDGDPALYGKCQAARRFLCGRPAKAAAP